MKTRVVMVYGSFDVPDTNNVNFILFRMPEGRCPWSKRIAPAVNRLVRTWYPKKKPRRDEPYYWNVDWDSYEEVWHTKKTRKFSWESGEIIEVFPNPLKYLTLYWITDQLTGHITRVFSLDAAERYCEHGSYCLVEERYIKPWELKVNWPERYRVAKGGCLNYGWW